MPASTGSRRRGNLSERPLPIVIVSAYTEEKLVERAADAGVFGYLAKPFREHDLMPAIATACAASTSWRRFGESRVLRMRSPPVRRSSVRRGSSRRRTA
jgi:response regulator NasT